MSPITGSLDRLVYGYDSYGFLCGTNNDGDLDSVEGPDLTEFKKLYYLNPLELLNPTNFKSAKSICVKTCPTAANICSMSNATDCQTGTLFRCPYYRFAEGDIYDQLTGVDSDWNTSYFDELGTLPNTPTCDITSLSQVRRHLEYFHSQRLTGDRRDRLRR